MIDEPSKQRQSLPSATGHGMTMRQAHASLEVDTNGPGLTEITEQVRQWVAGQHMREGLLTIFCQHTSASLLIQENAAPAVRDDLERFLARLVPEDGSYEHDDEEPDDMPAHIRAALTQTHLAIPLVGGTLALGQWQGLYLFEHRRRAQVRSIMLHLIGA